MFFFYRARLLSLILIWQRNYYLFLTSKIGLSAFVNSTLTSLLNLALIVGYSMPILHEISHNDLQPSFNNTFRIETSGLSSWIGMYLYHPKYTNILYLTIVIV